MKIVDAEFLPDLLLGRRWNLTRNDVLTQCARYADQRFGQHAFDRVSVDVGEVRGVDADEIQRQFAEQRDIRSAATDEAIDAKFAAKVVQYLAEYRSAVRMLMQRVLGEYETKLGGRQAGVAREQLNQRFQ